MDNLVKKGGDGSIKYKVYKAENKTTSLASNSITVEFDGAITFLLSMTCNSDGHYPTVSLNGSSVPNTRVARAGYYRDIFEYTIPVRKGDVLSYSDSQATNYTLLIVGVSGHLYNRSFQNSRTTAISASLTKSNRYILMFANALGAASMPSFSISGGKSTEILNNTTGTLKGKIYLVDATDTSSSVSITCNGSDTYKTLALYEF